MSDVAVVILNYNGEHYLRKFLPSLIEKTPEARVIVADNASTDGSIRYLEAEYRQVEIIQFDTNHGFAGGYNQALLQVEARYFVLLNSDVEVTTNWLPPLVQFLDAHPEYFACQPIVMDYNNRHLFEYAGAAGGFVDKLGYPFCRGRIFETIEENRGQYDKPTDVFWATGACMVIRSEIFIQIGGFDADFFAHMEEIDLCWRLHSAGMKAACIPGSTVFHVGGGTLSKVKPQKTYLNFRNNLIMLAKNLPLPSLLWILPVRIILDWIAGLKLARDHHAGHLGAVLKAQWHFLLSSVRHFRKRHKTSTPKKALLGDQSIIFQYFLKGRKRFSDINNTR